MRIDHFDRAHWYCLVSLGWGLNTLCVQKTRCRPTSVRYSHDSLSLFLSIFQHPPGGLWKMKDKNKYVAVEEYRCKNI